MSTISDVIVLVAMPTRIAQTPYFNITSIYFEKADAVRLVVGVRWNYVLHESLAKPNTPPFLPNAAIMVSARRSFLTTEVERLVR